MMFVGAIILVSFLFAGCGGSTDSWQSTSISGAPSERTGHTAVWTGTEMIVWGGYYQIGSVYLNTGGRYNPSTDSWTTTSTGTNVPSGRSGANAVWTATEMIVWGGANASTAFNSGGKYNPSTDSWTATNTGANVPTSRAFHTAIWTGSEMIVWGGMDFDGSSYSPCNNGGRYNPSTDSWKPTSTGANVPSGIDNHSAVWTGTEMIIWGGMDNSGNSSNTGGKYSPSSDSWTPTSTGANIPSARWWHAAVWTGTEMIIWGGEGMSGNSLNTGGRYNPAADSWTATGTGANVPAGRYFPSSVWTGTEMIVWGGGNRYGDALNTGGRYNPSTDSWKPTSTGANIPTERHHHTAVWTGTEMIVWGGIEGMASNYVNTGGRYLP